MTCTRCGLTTDLIAYWPMTDTYVRHCPVCQVLLTKTGDHEWVESGSTEE